MGRDGPVFVDVTLPFPSRPVPFAKQDKIARNIIWRDGLGLCCALFFFALSCAYECDSRVACSRTVAFSGVVLYLVLCPIGSRC